MKQAPLSVGFYADEDKSWADQDCLNFLPVKAEQPGGRSDLKLAPLAGLQEFAAYPDASRQRGGHVVEGRQFFVCDTSLCQLMPSGAIQILGTIPGTSRCAFAHNQITNGNQLFIATGTSAYVWNTVTSTLTQVTDTGFMGGLLAKFIGARFVTVDPARRFFQWSDLADGTEWNSSNFDAGESSPDRIRSIEVMGDDLVLLNERTIDFFAYTGTTNATFERRPNSLDRGCAASHACVKVDNGLFFIGNDGSGYMLRGYQLQRITTHPIEQKWAEFDLSKAFAFLHEFEGHKVVVVTFPDADEAGTWCYDVATGLWHRRASYGMARWRLAWLTAWNGGYYGGEFNSGRVFVLNKRYPLEGSDCISREFSPGCLHKGGQRSMLDALRLIVERGPRVEASAVIPLAFDLNPNTVDGLHIGGGLPDAAVGDTANHQYRTVGGRGVVTVTKLSGALPAGASLSADGRTITGTYTTAEHDNAWVMQAVDEGGNVATLVEAQYVMDMLGDPPDGDPGDPYSYFLTGSEGTAPYSFALAGGSFVSDLALASDGEIAGDDPQGGTSTFMVTMTDAAGVTQTKSYNIFIGVVPSFLFLASGALNKAQTSLTGLTWTDQTSGLSGETLRYMAVTGDSPSIVVASSVSGNMFRSLDYGVTWSTSSTALGYNVTGIACTEIGGTQTLIASTDVSFVLKSVDGGASWTAHAVGMVVVSGSKIAAGNGVFVLCSGSGGSAYYSTDGLTYALGSTFGAEAIHHNGDRFMMAGASGQSYTSVNGVIWTAGAAPGGGSYSFVSLCGHPGYFLAGANAGYGIYRSTDLGQNWTSVEALGNASICASSSGIDLFMGISIFVSTNGGTVWTSIGGITSDIDVVGVPS